jgi:hypothetical protein
MDFSNASKVFTIKIFWCSFQAAPFPLWWRCCRGSISCICLTSNPETVSLPSIYCFPYSINSLDLLGSFKEIWAAGALLRFFRCCQIHTFFARTKKWVLFETIDFSKAKAYSYSRIFCYDRCRKSWEVEIYSRFLMILLKLCYRWAIYGYGFCSISAYVWVEFWGAKFARFEYWFNF